MLRDALRKKTTTPGRLGRVAAALGSFRSERGAIAVEAAFAFPVILIAFFAIVEFANMALTIQVAENAVSTALTRFRDAGELGASAENDIRQGVVAYSHGYLEPENVTRVTLEAYESLDAMGNPGGKEDEEDEEDGAGDSFADAYPAWKVVVVISKDFITPIPRMLITNRKDFTYRYERVLAYYPKVDEEDAGD